MALHRERKGVYRNLIVVVVVEESRNVTRDITGSLLGMPPFFPLSSFLDNCFAPATWTLTCTQGHANVLVAVTLVSIICLIRTSEFEFKLQSKDKVVIDMLIALLTASRTPTQKHCAPIVH